MAQWLDAKVVKRIDWNDHLFSLAFSCKGFPSFNAGQFTKVGIEQADGKILSRPYSLVNSPKNPDLEIIAVPVEEGLLSPKLHELNKGDALKVMAPATGFLVLDEVPQSKHLWMIATGTGVGPFLSILASNEVWKKYEHISLVYGVRLAADIAYGELIQSFAGAYPDKFSFVPVVSREEHSGCLRGRIPSLLSSGEIQNQAKCELRAEHSQVMLCGNPDMIKDAMLELENMGLSKHLRRKPGQISMERYW